MSDPLTVLLVDDQELVRSGLRTVLRPAAGIEVVAEASDGLAAVDAATRLRPDVVLMDVRMPRLDGVEATRRIVAAGVGSRVLVLTTFDADELVLAALHAGASGFLLKDTAAARLAEAVVAVGRGDAVLSPGVTRSLLERVRGPATVAEAPPGPVATWRSAQGPAVATDGRQAPHGERLTGREHDVLGLLARGMSNSEIAGELGVGVSTVKSHVGTILLKLGVRDRVQAVVWWYERR